MTKRNILYGYQYNNGIIEINPTEERIIQRVAKAYLNGKSLLKIANMLNDEKVEYMPNVYGWNKARLMRLLDDERYLGDDVYPTIIDADTHSKIKDIKSGKYTKKNTDLDSDIFKLDVPVICPSCGCEMIRKHDIRWKSHQKWFCKNKDCKTTVGIKDEDLLSKITVLLNVTILNPELIKEQSSRDEISLDAMRLENEIGRTLESNQFNKEELKKKMIACVSEKYKAIGSMAQKTKRLRADFEKSSPLNNFSADLFSRTVKSIIFEPNQVVSILLLNGQRIGKE